MPELLAPAGNREKLEAAIRYGADAVYMAGNVFGMRAFADNFTLEELKDAAHKRLIISHCNAPKRAEAIKELILSKVKVKETIILNTAGLSSMYANDGGVIVAI